MKTICNQTFDQEREFYGSDGICLENCRFEGKADGESAFKESRNISVTHTHFYLRYPFWHDDHVSIESCHLYESCRAALWYSKDIHISNSQLHGIKALRECKDIVIENSSIQSTEFGWFNENIKMKDCQAQSEYFMMHSHNLQFDNVSLEGKYSFQYITDSIFTHCHFDTKDAFWHAKDVVIKDSVIKGEYLGWYCENVTFENCTIIGTQPLCYCKNLKCINCTMIDCDLSFEKSDVHATILSSIDSIKNPSSGLIQCPLVGQIIEDDRSMGALIQEGFTHGS